MYLNVIPASSCALNHIKVPAILRKALNLDQGDWLVFDTSLGPYSVMVVKASIDDVLKYGENKAFVNKNSPILDSALKEVYIEPHKLTIGSDPEFFFVDNYGQLVKAFKILPFESQVGCDAELGELRPEYALCPDQLTENIRHLMKELKRRTPSGLTPIASSYFKHRCSGFHVHLGMPIELLSFAADDTNKFFESLVSMLDYLIAIPAAALDTDDKRRLSRSYGRPGDYRLNMRTLEYRTPGGFHLKSPTYTKHLLSSAFKVVETVVHETEKASGGWKDLKSIADLSYFKSKYSIPNKYITHNILTSNKRSLLEDEAEKAHNILDTMMDEYTNNSVRERKENVKPLLSEWLEHETQFQIQVHNERRQADTHSRRG